MFTVTIKVNDRLVHSIYSHNKTDEGKQIAYKFKHGIALPDDYYYRYTDAETEEVIEGQVHHFRDDGIDQLTVAILQDVRKQKQARTVSHTPPEPRYKHLTRLGIKVYDGSIVSEDLTAKLTPKQRKEFSKLFGCQTMSGVGPYASDVEAVLVRMFEKRLTGTQLLMD